MRLSADSAKYVEVHRLSFNNLDASYSHVDVHDHPPALGIRRMHIHPYTAATVLGHGHPAAADHHIRSPTLPNSKQSLIRDFRKIWNAALSRLNSHKPQPKSSHHFTDHNSCNFYSFLDYFQHCAHLHCLSRRPGPCPRFWIFLCQL